MMNDIPRRQDEPLQIERLAAQRQLYQDAKKLQVAATVLVVPFPIIWPLIVGLSPSLAPFAAIWGISASLLDAIFFSPTVNNLKRNAARIQEEFDCYVLSLRWHDLHSGAKPEPEIVRRASNRFFQTGGDREKLSGWYPAIVGRLRLSLARIACQRASCWWDADLRRRYSRVVLVALVSVTLASLVIGISAGFTLAQYVQAVIAPLMPLAILSVKQWTENMSAARSLDDLRSHAESVWQKGLSGARDEELEAEARDLQCEIFSHRMSAPLIFDWIYYRLRNDQEELMNVGAEALVVEALAAEGEGYTPS
jgi:hypothetical protein